MSRDYRSYIKPRPKNKIVELDPELYYYNHNEKLRETLINCTKEELKQKKKNLKERLLCCAPEIAKEIFTTIDVINMLLKLK